MVEEKNEEVIDFNSQSSQSTNPPEKTDFNSTELPTQKSSNPTIAGILLIIAGVLGAITGIFLAIVGSLLPGMIGTIPTEYYNYSNFEITTGFIQNIYVFCGSIIIVLAIFTLLGGIMALKRKMWGLALLGAILGLFTVGLFFTSSILSLIALILIALSKQEFEQSGSM